MFNGKIIKQSDAALYCMPSLEDDRAGGTRLENAGDIQRRAYEEGFAAGEKAGFTEGKQQAGLLIERLESILRDTAVFKENLIDDLKDQLVDLAVAIARKIIITEISTDPEIIVTMVKEALKRLQRIGRITIKINPALQELFTEKKSEIMDIHQDIIFDVVTNLPVTAPLVISETEEVVTDIESLLNNIVEEMKGGASSESHAGGDGEI